MLKLSIFEWFFGAVPESLIVVFFLYVFSFTPINIRRLFISGISISIIIYLIRLLPIQSGIHTLMLIPIYVLISNSINKIPMYKAISSTILNMIVLIICEGLNIYIITNILHIDINETLKNTIAKTFYTYISMVLYLLVILSFYFTLYKKKMLNNNQYRQ